MCGICGFITDKSVNLEQLHQMNQAMYRRGPDDSGEEILQFTSHSEIGLGQQRLSIQDLSANGHQPFWSFDQKVVLVFNGEIYNFQELRQQLSEYPFVSQTDTEVIIAAYYRWKDDFLNHLEGMFAFALFDIERQELIIARDRIGKKPLYYYIGDNDFVFASTLSSILQFPGFHKEINTDSLPRFLLNKYIEGENTIFSNVFRLKPGQILKINSSGLTKSIYWDLVSEYQSESGHQNSNYDQCLQDLDETINQAVQKRLVADVPVGAFLSGGIDSSLVTAIAQKNSAQPLKTFSIGFNQPEFDEAPKACQIAEYLGTDHTAYYVSDEELLKTVEDIVECYDEPFADPSEIPSLIVAKLASKEVKVVLTGDGGDEFFCGYALYDKLRQAQRLEAVASILRPVLNHKVFETVLPYKVSSILKNEDRRYQTQLGREKYHQTISKMLNLSEENFSYDESCIDEKDWQIRRMLLDSITYLPENNLCKVDRSTMYYSLEARNPLLDVQVIQRAFSTPQKFKYFDGDKKHILKDLARHYIPSELLEGPKKGFAAPIDVWLRGPLKSELIRVSKKDYLTDQGLFNPDFTESLVLKYLDQGDSGAFSGNNMSNIIWPFFVFQKWYERYV